MNTIIVGAVDGYTWDQCELWWKSIKVSGFKGDIIILAYNLDKNTISEMQKRNINVIECEPGPHPQVVVYRFKDYSQVARLYSRDTWMVCTDVSDLVFQRNPNDFLENILDSIVVASEGIFFKGNKWVRENLMASFPNHYSRMENEILYNAGSFAATAGILKHLAEEVYVMCMKNPEAKNHDQAALNILLKDPNYGKITLFTHANDEWCYCGASSMFAKSEDASNYQEELPVIEDGLCHVLGHKLTTMFHHFNRDPGINQQVRRHYFDKYLEMFS